MKKKKKSTCCNKNVYRLITERSSKTTKIFLSAHWPAMTKNVCKKSSLYYLKTRNISESNLKFEISALGTQELFYAFLVSFLSSD